METSFKKLSHISGFPNWGQLVGGGNLDKMAKNCMKMTKSAFLDQNSGRGMAGQANFSGSGGIPLPLGETLHIFSNSFRDITS